jgi:uncharacterized protein YidB (DUF937 family)
MSGFFGQIANGLMGNAMSAASGGAAMQALPGLLSQLVGAAEGSSAGGLPALIAQFEAAGLGEHVQSWISGETNMPIAPEQLGQALPPEQVASMAQQAGTTPEILLQMLAHALPHAVDQATPGGELPPSGVPLPDFSVLLGRLFNR